MRHLRWAAIYAVCACVVLVVRFGLWLTKYQKLRQLLVRPCSPDPDIAKRATVARIVHAVERVAKFIPDASCLTQTISCQAVLSWKGIPTVIAMGVQKSSGDTLRVHAWLLWNDEIVLEGDETSLSGFTKIHDLPTPPLKAPRL